jgi:hypothetical protein
MQSLSFPGLPEPYVDAERAASFLAVSRKTLLAKSRSGQLPGHPSVKDREKYGDFVSRNSHDGWTGKRSN